MQRLEVSCAVRPIYRSLGFKGLRDPSIFCSVCSGSEPVQPPAQWVDFVIY